MRTVSQLAFVVVFFGLTKPINPLIPPTGFALSVPWSVGLWEAASQEVNVGWRQLLGVCFVFYFLCERSRKPGYPNTPLSVWFVSRDCVVLVAAAAAAAKWLNMSTHTLPLPVVPPPCLNSRGVASDRLLGLGWVRTRLRASGLLAVRCVCQCQLVAFATRSSIVHAPAPREIASIFLQTVWLEVQYGVPWVHLFTQNDGPFLGHGPKKQMGGYLGRGGKNHTVLSSQTAGLLSQVDTPQILLC